MNIAPHTFLRQVLLSSLFTSLFCLPLVATGQDFGEKLYYPPWELEEQGYKLRIVEGHGTVETIEVPWYSFHWQTRFEILTSDNSVAWLVDCNHNEETMASPASNHVLGYTSPGVIF